MEIRNGVEKLRGIEIREHHLELAKCLTCAAHDVQIIAGVKSNGGHIITQTPESIVIHQVILARFQMMEMQALGLGMLRANMLGNAINILHQLDGMLKCVGIHTLYQIRLDLGHASAIIANIIDLIGMVDIAHFYLLIGEKWARNTKCFTNPQELTSDILIHESTHECFSFFCFRSSTRAIKR